MPRKGIGPLLLMWGTYAASLAAILTVVFIVFPNIKPVQKAEHVSQSAAKDDLILGTWQQYGLNPTTQQWDYWGTFIVAKANGIYTMSPSEQPETPYLANSIGIFDIQSDGDTWSFDSKQTGGTASIFNLKRASDTEFEGTASSAGLPMTLTKWIKVQ